MKQFKYPVELLIKEVKDKPALWDKTAESYKDREERKQAWDEIFRRLENGFDDMTREDRRITGDLIINKWTNLRDTFIKSLKNQTTKSGTKKYHHHDEMAFLLKVMPQEIIPDLSTNASDDDDPISFNYMPGLKREMNHDLSDDDGEASSSLPEKREAKRPKKSDRSKRKYLELSSPESDYQRRKRSKKTESERRRSEPEDSPAVDFVEINEANDPRVMNEDEAFFASLLPTIVKYSEDERLEFRIEVLAVMKIINEKRRQKWTDGTND